MSKIIPRATSVTCDAEYLCVTLNDKRKIFVPLSWFPRLMKATPSQRENAHLIGYGSGIHWPDVDEDLSVRRLLHPDLEDLPDDAD